MAISSVMAAKTSFWSGPTDLMIALMYSFSYFALAANSD